MSSFSILGGTARLNNERANEREQTILIVEDVPIERISIMRESRNRGYHVVWASNTKEASKILERTNVTALLADVHLGPYTTAIDIVHHIRKQQPWSFVVCYSGHQGSEDVLEAKNVCDLFFEKPLDFEELFRSLNKGIAQREKQLVAWLMKQKSKLEIANPRPEEGSPEDSNYEAYIQEKEELLKEFEGQYVAYLDGKRVAADRDKDRLRGKVVEHFRRTDFFYIKVTREERIRKFLSPRRYNN
jgi:DNA-binding NtrC family response regulator